MTFLVILGLFHVVAGCLFAGRIFAPSNRTEHLLWGGLTAYLTFYMIPVTTGWITGYMNAWNVAAGGISAAVLAVSALLSRRLALPIPPLRHSTPLLKSRNPAELIILLVLALVLSVLFFMGTQLPVRAYDAPYYHMSNPLRWHMTGRFILDSFGDKELAPQIISAETAPNMKAVWPFLVLLFTRDTPGTCLAQFPFLLLMLCSVRALALRVGSAPWLASLAMLACLGVPEILFQSLEAYSDLAFLCGQVVVLWSLVHLWQQPFTWRSILAPALGFAILAGAKASFLFTGGVLGLFYGVLLLVRLVPLYRWKTPLYVGVALALTILAILCSGAPWLIHAWQKFDNPVYPFRIVLAGKTLWEGHFTPDVNHIMIKQFTGNEGWVALDNTLRETWRTPSISNWSGGLGAVMFIIGLPVLIFFPLTALWRGPDVGARRILTAGFILLVISCPTLANSRFSLFMPVVCIIGATYLFARFPWPGRLLAALLLLFTTAYTFYMVLPSIQYRQRPAPLLAFNLLSGHATAAQRDIHPGHYTALDFWREEISAANHRLALPPTSVPVWNAYAPWSPGDLLRVRRPSSPADLETWHRELLQAGITHLYWHAREPGFDWITARPGLFRPLFQTQGANVAGYLDGVNVEPPAPDALFILEATHD